MTTTGHTDLRTFCSDMVTSEPWSLANFAESNAEDPDCADDLARLDTLAIGESLCLGGGAVATMTVTRLS